MANLYTKIYNHSRIKMDIAIYIKDNQGWQLDKTVNSDDKNLHKEDKFFIDRLLIDGLEYIKVGHTMYSII